MQDAKKRIVELEKSVVDLKNNLEALEKDTDRMLSLVIQQGKILANVHANQELIAAKLP